MPPSDDLPPSVELELTSPAAGGEVVGRESSGRVVFASGGLPGERVRLVLTEERRDFARGRVTEVLRAAPDRAEPPCPQVARGCGGCDLQHLRPEAQPALKATVVRDALTRIGRVKDPAIVIAPPLPTSGFRTALRVAVRQGRAGLRRRRSHEVIDVDHCLVAHPLIDELLASADFGTADEATLRVAAGTGERLAVLSPSAEGAHFPHDVTVVGADQLRRGAHAALREVVDGVEFRVSATSFFQTRRDGAEALVAAVRRAAGPLAHGPARVIDAYSGVGLFARTIGVGDAHSAEDLERWVVAVERGRSSVADARHNLAASGATVVRADVAAWSAPRADLVIADPSRDGLGAQAVTRLAASGAGRFVLVSCDPAALGRDAGLLAEAGFALEGVELVDLFPHTHHIEAVSTFLR